MARIERGKHFLNLCCGENALLKFIFLLISILFIVEELYTFFILKPTLNKKIKTNLTKDDFPIFTVCPDPSLDLGEMALLGYYDIYSYKAGLGQESIIGWDANQTDSVQNISNKISLLKTVKDCPEWGIVFYKPHEHDVEDPGIEELEFQLTRAMFPYHLCCRVQTPEATKKFPITGLEIGIMNKSYSSFTVLVNDKVSHSIFEQHNSKVLGNNIRSPQRLGEFGRNSYKLKIHRDISLESDPNSDCVDYKKSGDYDKCLEAEIINQMMQFANCTPPWMTENDDLWCKKEHASSLMEINTKFFLNFINDLNSGQVDHGKCSTPCRKYSYYSTGLGFMDSMDTTGVTIFFDKIIDDTVTEFKIDSVTLLTRFGGVIGLTKNLLWIVLLFISIGGYFVSSPSGKVIQKNSKRYRK